MSFSIEQIDLCALLNKCAETMKDPDLLVVVSGRRQEIEALPFCLDDTTCLLKNTDRAHRHKCIHSPDPDHPILHQKIINIFRTL